MNIFVIAALVLVVILAVLLFLLRNKRALPAGSKAVPSAPGLTPLHQVQ